MSEFETLADKLKKDLTATNKVARDELERKVGTIYLLDPAEIKIASYSLFEKGTSLAQVLKPGITPSEAGRITQAKVTEWMLELARAAQQVAAPELKRLKISNTNILGGAANRYEHIQNLIDVFRGKGQLGDSTPFILKNHDQIQRMHRTMVAKLKVWLLEESGLISAGPQAQARVQRLLYDPKQAQKFAQGGHGAQIGVAVGQVQADKFLRERILTGLETGNISTAEIVGLEELRREVNAAFAKGIDPNLRAKGAPLRTILSDKDIDEINIHGVHNHLINDRGDFNEDFVTIVSFQSSGNNNEDSKREKALLTYIRTWLKANLITTYDPNKKYSPALVDRIQATLTSGLTKKLNKNTYKLKGKKTVSIKGKESWQNKVKTVIREQVESEALPKLNVNLKVNRKKKGKAATQGPSPLELIAYINTKLTQKLIGNMGEPRLVNRTGQFAKSVKVTQVSRTKGGAPSIGYTYEMEPYSVFEQGLGRLPWATPERDPRTLIDKTIREIAAELYLGRLYTRRL